MATITHTAPTSHGANCAMSVAEDLGSSEADLARGNSLSRSSEHLQPEYARTCARTAPSNAGTQGDLRNASLPYSAAAGPRVPYRPQARGGA